jgi:hypothetical protein
MEDRPKSDPPPSSDSDKVSEGWTGARPSEARSRLPKDSNPPSPRNADELEKQVNAGWDTPES